MQFIALRNINYKCGINMYIYTLNERIKGFFFYHEEKATQFSNFFFFCGFVCECKCRFFCALFIYGFDYGIVYINIYIRMQWTVYIYGAFNYYIYECVLQFYSALYTNKNDIFQICKPFTTFAKSLSIAPLGGCGVGAFSTFILLSLINITSFSRL